MKICFLGGNSAHVIRWINYFSNHDHNVSLITMSNDVVKVSEKVTVYYIKPIVLFNKKSKIRAFIRLREFKNYLKIINPDIIHAHGFFSYGLLTPFIKSKPIMVSAWGSDVLINPKKSKIFRLLLTRAIKTATALHVDGVKTKKALLSCGANKNRIFCIYFGTNCKIFNPDKFSYKHQENLRLESLFTIISTRGLRPIYSIDTIIKSIPFVIKSFENVRFVIVGKGPLMHELEELAIKLNVLKYVHFTGYVSDEELPVYLASSDVYISTSLSDAGLAASTAEAMASGLPVIVTDDPDNRTWVEDHVNGFIIPVKSPAKLAERIIYLIENKSKRLEFGKRNRKLILKKNNYFVEMNKMESLYNMLTKSS